MEEQLIHIIVIMMMNKTYHFFLPLSAMSVTPRKCPARSRASGFREGVGAGLLLQLGGSRRESGRFPPQVLPCSTPAAEGHSFSIGTNFSSFCSVHNSLAPPIHFPPIKILGTCSQKLKPRYSDYIFDIQTANILTFW